MRLRDRFPLTSLELSRAARRRDLFVYRYVVLVVMALSLLGLSRDPEWMSLYLQELVSAFQLIVVFVCAPLVATPMLQREKQEGTLALALMADWSGYDVVAAKQLCAFAATALLLLGTLPMVAIGSFFGGISVPREAAALALHLAWAFGACAASLLAATLTRSFSRAVLVAYGLLAATVGVHLWMMGWTSLGQGTRMVADLLRVGGGGLGVLTPLMLGVACLFLTARMLQRGYFASDRALPGLGGFWGRPLMRPRPIRNERDFLRRAIRSRVAVGSLTVPTVVAAVVLSPLSVLLCLGWVVVIAIAFVSGLRMTESIRRSGAFEELWMTPIDDHSLCGAIHRVLFGQLCFCLPAFTLAVGMSLAASARQPGWTPPLWALIALTAFAALGQVRFSSSYTLYYASRCLSPHDRSVLGIAEMALVHFSAFLLAAIWIMSPHVRPGSRVDALTEILIIGGVVLASVLYHALGQRFLRRCRQNFRHRMGGADA